MKPAIARGFTLIEVLVALAIVAISLSAGVQASGALTRLAQRQSSQWLAQLCADNALTQLRLQPQMPALGNATTTCPQGARTFEVNMLVEPTPNPSFRRVVAQVSDVAGETSGPLLQLSTVVGRY